MGRIARGVGFGLLGITAGSVMGTMGGCVTGFARDAYENPRGTDYNHKNPYESYIPKGAIIGAGVLGLLGIAKGLFGEDRNTISNLEWWLIYGGDFK